MRARLTPLFGALVLAVFIAPEMGGKAPANKVAVPPPAKDLVGVWIGFNSDDTFIRLDLHADSTGFCARVSPASTIPRDKRVSLYRVEKWAVNAWNIEIQMSPLSNAVKVDNVKGQIGLSSIRLTMRFSSIRLSKRGSKNAKWKDQLLLHSESEIMTSNQETKDEIGKAQTN
jgi:hypothetical protein